VTHLILASASPTRAKLLRAAGLSVELIPAHIDETAVKESLIAEKAPPRDIADVLAELKAAKISMAHPDAIVIGADQVLVFHGELVSKSEDLESAKHLLQRLSGDSHELLTAAVLAKNGAVVWRHITHSRLTMRTLSDAYLDGYLARQGADILGSVGCYRLEGEGVQLFSNVSGDYFAILGLPLLPLLTALREMGALEA
jgi:septum formation protein